MISILCGHTCAGKTTLANAYRACYGIESLDTDRMLLEQFPDCDTIGALHETLGDKAFRKTEADILQALRPQGSMVIATGGGAVLDPHTVRHVQQLGQCIYLRVDEAVLSERIKQLSARPSFLKGENFKQRLHTYFLERHRVYEAVCEQVIDTGRLSLAQAVQALHQYRESYVK